MSAAPTRADRLYAGLLWLLPGRFRREYGAAMRQTFADRCAARTDGRGVALLLARELADLGGGAAGEWAATVFARDRWHRAAVAVFARDRWHRAAAVALCVLAGMLVLYGALRHPAGLLSADRLTEYPPLLAVLAGLALAFTRDATVSPRTVGCALATVPGWVAGAWSFGYVAALILLAAVLEARRGGPHAGIRSGVTAGLLAGVGVLAVRVGDGVLGTMHGRSDSVVGSRVCGGAILLLACVGVGAVLGAGVWAGTAVAGRRGV